MEWSFNSAFGNTESGVDYLLCKMCQMVEYEKKKKKKNTFKKKIGVGSSLGLSQY